VLASDQDLRVTWSPVGYTSADVVTVRIEGITVVRNGVEDVSPKTICRTRAWEGPLTVSKSRLSPYTHKGTVWIRMTVGPHPATRALFRVLQTDGTLIPAYAEPALTPRSKCWWSSYFLGSANTYNAFAPLGGLTPGA
jgi:hypothetical protein